jgi:hypothetical protein
MRIVGGFGVFLLPLLLLGAAPAAAADLVLSAAEGPYVEAELNGVRLRLKVEFDLLPDITLNPAAAARAGLAPKGRWIQQIGPVKLRGRTARVPLTLAGVPIESGVRWQQRDAVAGADGLVSIHVLPFDSVTIERRGVGGGGGEREIVLQARVHDGHGVFVPVPVGGRRIAARLSFSRPRTTAPAAAVAVIARHHGGTLGTERGVEEIGFGVMRPVRPFRLARPLPVGALSVPAMMARTADFRGDHKLALPRPEGEDGEIVVAGQTPSQDSLYRITLGLDVLGRCSAASYSRASRTIRLRCAAQ